VKTGGQKDGRAERWAGRKMGGQKDGRAERWEADMERLLIKYRLSFG
jgi:hypothetical protein